MKSTMMPLVEQILGDHHLSNWILTLPRIFNGKVFPPLWFVWGYCGCTSGVYPTSVYPSPNLSNDEQIHGHGTRPSFVLTEFQQWWWKPFLFLLCCQASFALMSASSILGLISRCQSENKGFDSTMSFFKINEKKMGGSLLDISG